MNDALKIKVVSKIVADVFQYGSNDNADYLIGVLSAIDSVISMEDGEPE